MKTGRIFLVGLMGSGKSYWGRKIAAMLQWKFVDLDKHIAKHEKTSIPEIFKKHGESHFRTIENKYLKDMLLMERIVVATGGGTPCFRGNMKWMNRNGTTYYLKVKPETSAKRLKNQTENRPLLKGKSGNELVSFLTRQLKARKPFYAQAYRTLNAEILDEFQLEEII